MSISSQGNAPINNTLYSQSTATTSSDPFITVFSERDPTQYDYNFPIKKRWLNVPEVKEWILISFSNSTGPTLATWVLISAGGTPSIEKVYGDDGTVNEVIPDANQRIGFTGNTVATLTHAKPIFFRKDSTSVEALDVQVSTEAAATDINNAGLSSYLNTQFIVDANGFVSLVGGTGPSLMTLSDNVDTKVSPDGTGNIKLEGQLNEQSGFFSTTVSDAANNLIKINPMSGSRWIVDPLSTATNPNGTHTTITAATASATSGDTIVILDGTYTENFTVKAGVDYVGVGHVIINGKVTHNTSGTVNFRNITLQTNSDFCLVNSGSVASIINLYTCFINATNNTAISYTSSSSSSSIDFIESIGNLGTTGIAYFASTSPGTIGFSYCNLANTGASALANTASAGAFAASYTSFGNGFTGTGTSAMVVSICRFQTGNNQSANIGGSGLNSATFTTFESGTAVPLNVDTTMSIHGINLISTNVVSVSGAGTINYSDISSSLATSTMTVTTQNSGNLRAGVIRSTQQPLVIANVGTTITDVTGDGTTYTIIFGNEITDQAGDYNNGTGVFTARYTGSYQFNVNVTLGDLAAGNTAGNVILVTTARSYTIAALNVGVVRNTSNNLTVSGSVIANMTAGDTASVTTTVAGGAKIVDIAGVSGSLSETSLSIAMLC